MLVLGAETETGRDVAGALGDAGARLAVVAAAPDADAAFAVQRLARRLSAIAQAIDATNEAAVRVMARQVAKQLGGLDAVVFSASDTRGLPHAARFGGRELARAGGGVFVVIGAEVPAIGVPAGVRLVRLPAAGEIASQAVRAVAGETSAG